MVNMVLYILNKYPVASETFIHREITGLRRHGVDVQVVSLRDGDSDRLRLQDLPAEEASDDVQLSRAIINTPSVLSPTGVAAQLYFFIRRPVAYASLLFRLTIREGLSPWSCLKSIRRFCRAVAIAYRAKERHPRRVHAHFAHVAADAAQVIRTFLDIPYSISVHAWDIYTQPAAEIAARIHAADFLIACTEHGARHIRRNLGNRLDIPIHTIPHGLPVDLFDWSNLSDGQILAVGRLVRKKGFIHLIRACRILSESGVDFQCSIIGDGPERRHLQQAIDRAGLKNKVTLKGGRPLRDVKDALGQAALFVLPSVVDKEGDRDGLANVILEAMAAGVPVISTTASAACEVIEDEHTGLLVSPGDIRGLAEACRRLLENRDLADRLRHAGRERMIRTYDLSKTIPPLAALLQPPGL